MDKKITLAVIFIITSSIFSMEHSNNTIINYKKREAAELKSKKNKKLKLSNLTGMLIEQPGTLEFQAAWCAVLAGKALPPHISQLEDKIKNIQQADNCPQLEKQLFINLVNHPALSQQKIQQYFPELIKKYLPGSEFKDKIQLLNSILLNSSGYGKSEQLIQLALDAGANINAMDEDGNTALGIATSCMKPEEPEYKKIAKFLINKGINVNIKNDYSVSPLLWLNNKDIEIVQMLIDAHSDVNVQDTFGRSPLESAAGAGNKDIVLILLKAGANVNIKDKRGDTPLIDAARNGHVDITKILIEAGADINTQNKNGKTALYFAQYTSLYNSKLNTNRQKIADILKELGAQDEIKNEAEVYVDYCNIYY